MRANVEFYDFLKFLVIIGLAPATFLKETRLIISCTFLGKIANRVCYANIAVSSTTMTVKFKTRN